MVAPIPKKTLAILWVANAILKARPRKMRAGNCMSPAPPPAKAEKIFAIKDMANKIKELV